MAWKLRKDKLKAGVPEAETPAEAAATPETGERESAPVFDLSGSAFQPQTVDTPEEEPEVPSFLDDDHPAAHVSKPAPAEVPEAGPISLEPLPEFDPVISPTLGTEPEVIAIAPPAFSPDSDAADMPMPTLSRQELTPEREAVASGLVTMETESGLPRVAPFVLDAPPIAPAPEPPRMHSVVIRIGNLSGTHFLTKDVTTIGRPDSTVQNYPDVEIELDDSISRRHAEIRQEGSEYTLTDVGSTNGTVLNGEPLTPQRPVALRPGDQIRLGERTELLFE